MSNVAQEYVCPVLMRQRIENAIEALLTLLDEMEGDTDLEDGADDEYYTGSTTDREHDTSDDEPYLSTGAYHWGLSQPHLIDGEMDAVEADYPGYVAGGQGA